MGSVRLAAHEEQPPLDMQRGMGQITAAYESLRSTLRCRADWSEQEVIEELEALALAASNLAGGLQRRREHFDYSRRPRRAAAVLSENFFAGCH